MAICLGEVERVGVALRGEKAAVKVSVVIVNWNTRGLLIRCLDHLQRVELPRSTEILVVDNGSWDNSADAVRVGFADVKVLVNRENLGFAKASNQGLECSRGQYILLLNPDCYPQVSAIKILLDWMETNPEVGIAGGSLFHPDGRPQHSFGAAPTLATELLPKGFLQILLPRRYPSKRRPPRMPMDVEAVLGAFLMVRREAWMRVGGMDEGYFLFLEETDWCMRMRNTGWRVTHVPGARALHLQGQSAANEPARARVEYHRSRYRFFATHRGRVSRIALHGGIFLKSVLNWIFSGIIPRLAVMDRDKWIKRHGVDGILLRWYLRGCPKGWGLAPGSKGEATSLQ
jgi:GT2 family glycosyltransferase